MNKGLLQTTALCVAMLAASCSSSDDATFVNDPVDQVHSVTFTLRTPAGEKVSYSRADAIHDVYEYGIKSLVLYEYAVGNDGSTTLARVMKYPNGSGRDAIQLVDCGDGSYTFSVVVPAANEGKKFSYKFVANDPTSNPVLGSSFDDFSLYKAKLALEEGASADDLVENGIAMTGVAKSGSEEVITMTKGVACTVGMQRIVSRIDICYSTPNLMLTKVELRGAPKSGYLFSQLTIDTPAEEDMLTMALNNNLDLPEFYLNDSEKNVEGLKKVELKKAFYLYERANSETSGAVVHIEYTVAANGTSYSGDIDVPFRKTSGDKGYVDAERNHLYTIVLGNGNDPVAGKVKATLKVDEWNLVEVDEPITDDDAVKN